MIAAYIVFFVLSSLLTYVLGTSLATLMRLRRGLLANPVFCSPQWLALNLLILSVLLFFINPYLRGNGDEIVLQRLWLISSVFGFLVGWNAGWTNVPRDLSVPKKIEKVLNKVVRAHFDEGLQQAYSVLEDNLELLNEIYNVFTQPSQNWLSVTPDNAIALLDFCSVIQQFPRGNRSLNLEIAIAGYQLITPIITRNSDPENWGNLQHNLGTAYVQRICGEKKENIEQAINYYNQALQVHTREADPQGWAKTQNDLGGAYAQRIDGEKAENMEQAIEYFEHALQVRTREADPQGWAQTKTCLGIAYSDRIRGERAENLEQAITHLKRALQVRTRESDPDGWAETQHNLGRTYLNRIREERAENLERALKCYEGVLQVCTRDRFPQYWGMAKNDQAAVYIERMRGVLSENIKRAIDCCEDALTVRTRNDFPIGWAKTKHILASAYIKASYMEPIQEVEAKPLERAIACCEEALNVFTREAFPQYWVGIQMTLAAVYMERDLRSRLSNRKSQKILEVLEVAAENIERAITCYEKVLTVNTRETFPKGWADIQHNLAIAYTRRIRGEQAENLKRAIEYGCNALKVRTREAFPEDYATTQYNLGCAYQYTEQFRKAYHAFAEAIKTAEFLRSEILFGSGREEDKQAIAEESSIGYQSMVEVCLELAKEDLQYYNRAIEYVERNKTRNLVELIAIRDHYPKGKIPSTVLEELKRLRREFAAELQRVKTEAPLLAQSLFLSDGREEELEEVSPSYRREAKRSLSGSRLNALRQQLEELLTQKIQPIDPNFSLTQKVTPISFSEIQVLTGKNTAILEWYITNKIFLTFIITPQSQNPIVRQFSFEDLKALNSWIDDYITAYFENKNQWLKDLARRLQHLANILHLEDLLLKQIPSTIDKVILIPHRYLHLLPIHSLPLSNGDLMLNSFKKGVRYAPSCQLLQLAQKRERHYFTKLFAIQNPTKDLSYADLEVQVIQSYFDSADVNVLEKATATKTVLDRTPLNTVHCAHFSCHGYFNPNPGQANKSALVLADGKLDPPPPELAPEHHLLLADGTVLDLNKCLTLGEIFTLNLDQCRLVILSACETGLIDFRNISDEYIGLVSGFLFAGSPSVVSSLWKVDQVSTAFLLVKFYENLRNTELKEGDVAVALQDAQNWLRNLTCEGIEQELNKSQYQQAIAQLQQKLSPAEFFELEDAIEVQLQKLQKLDRNHKPFANPYYWAAFIATGV